MSTPVRLERDGRGPIAELVFDDPDREVNVLSLAAIGALDGALDELAAADGVEGLLVRSAKPGTFIAGADIDEIADVTEATIAVGHSARVQSVFLRLQRLPMPVVAAIDGACLGGGLELAMACRHRLASAAAHTRLGLPEVKLGIIPGFGGTQQLPRIVGVRRALEMILKGYQLDGDDAHRCRLVDAVLPAEDFADRARQWLRAGLAGRRPMRRDGLPWVDRALLALGPLRDLYFLLAERQVRRRTRGQYPAPLAAISALREGLRLPLEEGLEVEAGLVGGLVVSPECKSLIHLFQLSESNRKRPGVDVELALPIDKAAVLGAGVMGAGIAALLAQAAIPVRLRDLSLGALGRGLRSARKALAASRRAVDAVDDSMRLILPSLELTGLVRADIVIEAVVEKIEVKAALLAEVEERIRPGAIFATNTSALSISTLQSSARHPERVVGMHFFNPVHRMPLVEVVRGEQTGAVAVATVVRLARSLGKVPVIVADGPGFLVNRVLGPYLLESLLLASEGTRIDDIEQAMLDFGMPMGPLTLLDEVGLDVAAHTASTLRAAFPDRFPPTPLLERMVDRGCLGRKSGRGFWVHGKGGRRRNPQVVAVLRELGVRRSRGGAELGQIQERLVLAMVNEAARAWDEGIVATPGECDLAMVLGAGFPPFRGGVLAFARALGLGQVGATLERLEAEHGPRFRPAPGIALLGSTGPGGNGLGSTGRARAKKNSSTWDEESGGVRRRK